MNFDLVQIQRLGEQKRGENERFRRHLKTYRYVERKLVKMAQEIEDQIDCQQCANCCRVATVKLMERDVDRLARFLRISESAFLRDYTSDSPEEGLILKRTDAEGCVFLSGTTCTVYEARPTNCTYFPHIVRGGTGPISTRMWQFIDRACYCPIVFHSLEAWKAETGFTR